MDACSDQLQPTRGKGFPGWHYLLTALLFVLFYSPTLRPNSRLILSDYLDQNVPNRVVASRAIREGRLPHWTDAVFGGFPFLSDPQTAVFYPPHLLLAGLFDHVGTSAIMDSFLLLHVLFMGWGMVFLARALGIGRTGSVVAAVIAMFNGYTIMHLSHTVIIEPIACGFWACGALVYALRRSSLKWAITAGMLFASAILAGHWQTAMYVCYCGGIGGLVLILNEYLKNRDFLRLRSSLLILGVPFVFAVLGTLVQTLPTLLLLENSSRKELTLDHAMMFSWPLRQAAGLLMPGLYQPLTWDMPPHAWFHVTYANWGEYGAWEYMHWIGLSTFLLALYGWITHRRSLPANVLFFGFLVIWIASIRESGIYPLLYEHWPGFKQVRIPPRMLFGVTAGWGLLAGMGLDAVLGSVAERGKIGAARAMAILAGILFVGSGAVALLISASPESWQDLAGRMLVFDLTKPLPENLTLSDLVKYAFHQLMLTTAVAAAFTAGFLLILARRGRMLYASVAIMTLFAELAAYGIHRNIGHNYAGFTSGVTGFWKVVPDDMEGRVIFDQNDPWGKNGSLVVRKEYAGGYNPLLLKRTEAFLPVEDRITHSEVDEKLLDTWNVTTKIIANMPVTLAADSITSEVPGAGWLQLAGYPESRSRLSWSVDTTSPLERVHLVATAGCVLGMPDDTLIGIMRLRDTGGEVLSTQPLRLGKEIAEWSYDDPLHKGIASHQRARVIYERSISPVERPTGNFYIMTMDVSSTGTAATVDVEITAAPPVFLAISHLIAESEEASRVYLPYEGLGYRLLNSPADEWLIFARPRKSAPAWVVPTAVPSSYKKDYKWMLERFRHPDFDPQRMVLLDKNRFMEGEVASMNAPQPADFEGTATLHKGSTPETKAVEVSANQQGWLVLSHTYYPGWKARLDGQVVPLHAANGAHMAVHVPAGDHRIELEFETPQFWNGAFVSSLTWGLGLGFLLLPGRRRKWHSGSALT